MPGCNSRSLCRDLPGFFRPLSQLAPFLQLGYRPIFDACNLPGDQTVIPSRVLPYRYLVHTNFTSGTPTIMSASFDDLQEFHPFEPRYAYFLESFRNDRSVENSMVTTF